jgi:AcrR family transcriptional regulator
MRTAQRRLNLQEALIGIAERSIKSRGLDGMRARDLAAEVGCSVGAIYNVFSDLDDLVLSVNKRTLAVMETELAAAAGAPLIGGKHDVDEAIEQMVRLALAYLHFAASHARLWRALFDHRSPEGKSLPEWYLDQQQRMFAFIEQPLRILQPNLRGKQFELLARSLFSAVHGIVVLGLDEKLGAVSVPDIEKQIRIIVQAIGHGFLAQASALSQEACAK